MRFSKQDIELWQQATRGVRTLLAENEAELSIQEPSEPAPTVQLKPKEPQPKPVHKQKHIAELAVDQINRMDGASFARLKMGKIRPDLVADLHGMGLVEARMFFYELVLQAFAAKKRCILVITGKGFVAPSKIRAALPNWVNDSDLKPFILSFTHAQPKDGGEGAFYVYLARN